MLLLGACVGALAIGAWPVLRGQVALVSSEDGGVSPGDAVRLLAEEGDADAEKLGAAADAAQSVLSGLEDGAELDEEGSSAFLARLDETSGGAQGCAGVGWREEAGLVEVAERVLGRYAHSEGAQLAAAGYLDLSGNAWGAVIRLAGGAVDIAVLVESEEGCLARVVRLSA